MNTNLDIRTSTSTGSGTIAVASLSAEALAYAQASRSASTLRAYRTDFDAFALWCKVRGVEALPASPATVAEYVTHLAGSHKASTITRKVASMSVAHQAAGLPTPTHDATVKAVLTGVRRTLGTAPREAAPATIGEVRRMVARIDRDSLNGKRDIALILVGFALAARRSELVAMIVEDCTRSTDGITVRVGRSKSDQEGRGAVRVLVAGTDAETCPIIALGEWLEAAAITTGPVFRPIDRHGNVASHNLSGNSVCSIVKKRAAAAGLDPEHYSGHSLRSGHITTAAANGRPEREIAAQSGHAPGSTVLRRYIRHGSRFTENSAKHLGL